jgi:hypothetical protein
MGESTLRMESEDGRLNSRLHVHQGNSMFYECPPRHSMFYECPSQNSMFNECPSQNSMFYECPSLK